MEGTKFWGIVASLAATLSGTIAYSQQPEFDELARWLQGSPHEQAWHRILATEDLVPQLVLGPQADPDVVARVLRRYEGKDPGLRLKPFGRVRAALKAWLARLRQADRPLPELVQQAQGLSVPKQLAAEYRKRLQELRQLAARPPEKLSFAEHRRIVATLLWLEEHKLAPTLQLALRRRFTAPGAWVEVDQQMFRALLVDPEPEEVEIRETILGAAVRGRGVFRAHAQLRLVPSVRQGRLLALVEGEITARTTSYQRKVRVFSRSRTEFRARKPLLVKSRSVEALESQVDVQAHNRPYAVSTGGCNCGLIQRIVWNQVQKRLPAARAEAESKARRRIARRIDRRVEEQLAEVNQRLQQDLLQPLEKEYNALPLVQTATSTRRLFFAARQQRFDLAPTRVPPPASPAGADVVVKVHQALLNNTFQWVFAGRTLKREDLQQRWGDLLPPPPEDEEEKDWQITFASRAPIIVQFARNQFRVLIRGRQFGKRRQAMTVSVHYRIVQERGKPKAVRVGPIQALPPGATPKTQLSGSEVALQRQLQKRFQRVFGPELLHEPIVLQDPQQRQTRGQLQLVHLSSKEGWLVLGWKYVPEKKSTAEPQRQAALPLVAQSP